ncbi:MAG: hypothetical protein LC754_08120 [Acidobacteria bacterium]|nr:hypothetical protein [Acidobacteriota bacterium]
MRFNPDEYITVHERVEKFYAKYPDGRITTTIVEHDRESGFILIRAEIFRSPDDALPAATGHAYELRSSGHVQQGSYVEVCETSSVGRALALLGFEVRRGIASREEMEKATRKQPQPPATAPPKPATAERTPPDMDAEILRAAGELGYDAAKVRKWVNQKFEVAGGLGSLTEQDKREVLKIFREKAQAPQAKTARK